MLIPQFMARRGHYVQPLDFLNLGGRYVKKDEIDQVWKVVPKD